MRLLVATNKVPRYRVSFLNSLARLCELVVVCTDREFDHNAPNIHFSVSRLSRLDIPMQWRHPAFREQRSLEIPLGLVRSIRHYRPHVVVTAEAGARTALAVAARPFAGRPMIVPHLDLSDVTEEGVGPLRTLFRQALLRLVDGVLVNGVAGKRYVVRLAARRTRIGYLPYSSDPQFLEAPVARKTTAGSVTVLYVGRLVEGKGVVSFLKLLARYLSARPEMRVTFEVVGSGPQEASIRGLRTPDNLMVHLKGEIDYGTLPAVYGRADLFALPTYADTWGVVVNEAMASGLPVLGSSASGAVEELVRDGHTGWVFRVDDEDAVLSAIDRALSTSPETLAAMGTECRIAAGRLSPEATARSLVATLEAWLGR